MPAFEREIYAEQIFNTLILSKEQIKNVTFQQCQFKQCKFNDVIFSKMTFIDCDFEACDLSLTKLVGCKFSEVSFKNCNLAGINWTELNWPIVKLASPLYFYNCNLSHSSFFGLELADLIMEECKAHDVDFREANLNHASFIGTDFQNSLFMHTKLKHADFTNAIHYTIDIHFNCITNAIFSFPEVISLLNFLDIKINGWPNDQDN